MVVYFDNALILWKKNSSLPREEPHVIFYIPAKERFAGAHGLPLWLFASSVNCDLGGQWVANSYGPL